MEHSLVKAESSETVKGEIVTFLRESGGLSQEIAKGNLPIFALAIVPDIEPSFFVYSGLRYAGIESRS